MLAEAVGGEATGCGVTFLAAGDEIENRRARDAAADVMLEEDILATMQAAVTLIVELEDQAQAAEAAAKRARVSAWCSQTQADSRW